MFELTVHFKHEIIGMWQRFQWNFELTVFELTVSDLYRCPVRLHLHFHWYRCIREQDFVPPVDRHLPFHYRCEDY